MDYIDWIISSVVFVAVIALVLISTYNLFPTNINTNNNVVGDGIYYSLVSKIIPVYNISMDNNSGEAFAYSLSLENNYGRASNTFFIDADSNIFYGTIYQKDKFFNYQTEVTALDGLGLLMLEENFNDFNLEDSFSIIFGDARVKSGILEMDEDTIIETNSSFSRYVATFTTDSNNIRAYINYTDEDNYLYCDYNKDVIGIYKVESGEVTGQSTAPVTDSNNWNKLFFGYYEDGVKVYFFCGNSENNKLLDNSIILSLESAKIRIESFDNNTHIDDFKVYSGITNCAIDNGSEIVYPSLTVQPDPPEYGPNCLLITLADYGSKFVLNYYDNITSYNSGNIKIYKIGDGETKSVFFPYVKEFWNYYYNRENGFANLHVENSKLNNFSSSTTNGLLKNYGSDSVERHYYVPLTIIKEEGIVIDEILSFDVNFTKAFNEQNVSSEESDEILIKYTSVCSESEGLQSIVDYNFSFDGDTNQASILVKLPEKISVNCPLNIVIGFNSINLANHENAELIDPTAVTATQLTARSTELPGITINTNQIYAYNFYYSGLEEPSQKLTLIVDVFDENGNIPQNCDFQFQGIYFAITCGQNAILKLRYRFANPDEIDLDYPKINVTKTKEQIIPEDHFSGLSCDSFFARIISKSLDINCNTGVNPIYKNSTKFLYNNGTLENTTIYIKPYN